MSCYATICHDVTICHVTSQYVMLRYNMSCYVTICHVTFQYVTMCHDVSQFHDVTMCHNVMKCHDISQCHDICINLLKVTLNTHRPSEVV